MSDTDQISSFGYATLVDRTGNGGCEIIYDGKRIVFKPGQTEENVPDFVARWLFRVEQHMVHTTDGEYTQRFGIKAAPADLIQEIGEQPCSPITIDTRRIEGWNADAYALDRDPARQRVLELRRNPADFANVATQGGFGSER